MAIKVYTRAVTAITLILSVLPTTKAHGTPSIQEITQWLASKIQIHSYEIIGPPNSRTSTKYELKASDSCQVIFYHSRTISSTDTYHSSRVVSEYTTTIPLSQISANSVEATDRGATISWVSFNAAKGKPYDQKLVETSTATGEDERKTESESSLSEFSFPVQHKSLAVRFARALRYLAERCNAENEPF